MVVCCDIKTKVVRPVCPTCNRCMSGKAGTVKHHGKVYYKKECLGCSKERKFGKRHPIKKSKMYQRPWLAHRKSTCEACGFIPAWVGQLDVDHIDGDKLNNSVNNLQTLCANCHRLKSHLKQDYMNKISRGGY